ncbi:hypothetical protein [Streptomyces sp. NPDC050560]|uniref:hypothetical protein n=1 Tax=Streptomyces sp. NPDC050560 TaxID=3365630 RepID=UPI003791EFE0
MTTEPIKRDADQAHEHTAHRGLDERAAEPDGYADHDDYAERGARGDDVELGVEAPEEDTAEQYADAAPAPADELPEGDPDNAAEADRAEQGRVVELDEDDYR